MSLRHHAMKGLRDPITAVATAIVGSAALWLGFCYPAIGLALVIPGVFFLRIVLQYRQQRRRNGGLQRRRP